jgi:hypothetical protein
VYTDNTDHVSYNTDHVSYNTDHVSFPISDIGLRSIVIMKSWRENIGRTFPSILQSMEQTFLVHLLILTRLFGTSIS